MAGSGTGDSVAENDLFADAPSVSDGNNDEEEQSSQRLQAPPVPGASDALLEENDNSAGLAELEDVPMANTKKRKSVNRGPKLDAKRLLGPRGIPAISEHFENVKLKGRGHEVQDLNLIMSRLEHWAHRLYPKLTFDDCLEKIETLGHKKEIQTCLKKLRMGMEIMDDEFQTTVVTEDGPQIQEGVESDNEFGEIEQDNDEEISNLFPTTSNLDSANEETEAPQASISVDEAEALSAASPVS